MFLTDFITPSFCTSISFEGFYRIMIVLTFHINLLPLENWMDLSLIIKKQDYYKRSHGPMIETFSPRQMLKGKIYGFLWKVSRLKLAKVGPNYLWWVTYMNSNCLVLVIKTRWPIKTTRKNYVCQFWPIYIHYKTTLECIRKATSEKYFFWYLMRYRHWKRVITMVFCINI